MGRRVVNITTHLVEINRFGNIQSLECYLVFV